MEQRSRVPMATFALVIIVGCSSSSSPGGGGTTDGGGAPPDLTAAAQDAAKAMCDRTQACAPSLVTGLYGDVAGCVARVTSTFVATIGAKGSNVTAVSMAACTQELTTTACGDFLSNQLPAACAPAGTIAAGAACAVDAQCATSHCKLTAGTMCGTCATRAPSGGACGAASDCEAGLWCVSGACAKLGTSGTACSASAPCRGNLVCRSGSCADPVGVGTACAQGDGCDELHGITCSTGSKQCVAVTYGGTNAGCGFVPSGVELCAASGFCKGLTSPKYQGTCVAAAADGAACDNTDGPYCSAGAVCIDHKCAVADPTKCQ